MKNEICVVDKKRYVFHIMRELFLIENLTDKLPEEQVFKILLTGGFTSIGFVKFVAERTHIDVLTVSTLRVGKKQLEVLQELHRVGKLGKVNFIVGSIMKDDSSLGKSYGYYQMLLDMCERYGWTVSVANNHSKVLLFDTRSGKYVIETSSNLNENPKMEQFSFEKNEELFDFYTKAFETLLSDCEE